MSGIHFSNSYWTPPSEEHFRLLRLAKPDTIKTLIFTSPHLDQVGIHARLKHEHPNARIVARCYADMSGGMWGVSQFADAFAPCIAELQGSVRWFEIHNEPNLYFEWPGTAHEFTKWSIGVLRALRYRFPWAKFVFPGMAINDNYRQWWDICALAIRQYDAFGVHCYWQFDNWDHDYFGRAYEHAHALVPDVEIIVTEAGDSTPGRSINEKIPGYVAWANSLPSYVTGSAFYILGGTDDWSEFELNEAACRALGDIPQAKVPVGRYSIARPVVGGRVSQWFGEHPEWYDRFGMAGHNGLDYAIPVGTDVRASHAGVVTCKDDPSGYGLHIKVAGQYVTTIYAHLSEFVARDGDEVRLGQVIGKSGNTGNSTGPHLHFGIRIHGMVNPAYYDWLDPTRFRYDYDEEAGTK